MNGRRRSCAPPSRSATQRLRIPCLSTLSGSSRSTELTLKNSNNGSRLREKIRREVEMLPGGLSIYSMRRKGGTLPLTGEQASKSWDSAESAAYSRRSYI